MPAPLSNLTMVPGWMVRVAPFDTVRVPVISYTCVLTKVVSVVTLREG